ncbi:MAG TPA: DUF4382 domain-containing protein [Longimicrobiales bacterium]
MRSTRLFLPLIAAAALALGACDDGVSTGGSGRLTIKLTDAPGDLAAAYVKFDKIILLRSAADSMVADSMRRIEFVPTVTDYINLLNLTGGQLLDLVSGASVPEGAYSQLRVVVTDAYITTKDGRTFATAGATLPAGVTSSGTLKCPSCAQSGYKVSFSGGGLNILGNSTVVLDFDAQQTFGHEAGKSGQWIMHPVLRATATTIRFAKITGNVAVMDTTVKIPTCGGQANTLAIFQPLATAGTTTLTGIVDSLGAYKIGSVLPGTYTMGYAQDVSFTNGDTLTFAATPSVATVTVAEADSATANYQITAATCH